MHDGETQGDQCQGAVTDLTYHQQEYNVPFAKVSQVQILGLKLEIFFW